MIPDLLRYTCLFALGAVVGTYVNRGIYRLAWFQRSISPWSAPHPDASERHWFDCVPILGWVSLRRESSIHGRGFWVRPLLIELATGTCFALLYWYEVRQAAVVTLDLTLGLSPGLTNPLSDSVLHSQYFSHIILFSLMLVATFIDFDEQTIPDTITVPGTIIGLLLAFAWPATRAIAIVGAPGVGRSSETSPGSPISSNTLLGFFRPFTAKRSISLTRMPLPACSRVSSLMRIFVP